MVVARHEAAVASGSLGKPAAPAHIEMQAPPCMLRPALGLDGLDGSDGSDGLHLGDLAAITVPVSLVSAFLSSLVSLH